MALLGSVSRADRLLGARLEPSDCTWSFCLCLSLLFHFLFLFDFVFLSLVLIHPVLFMYLDGSI